MSEPIDLAEIEREVRCAAYGCKLGRDEVLALIRAVRATKKYQSELERHGTAEYKPLIDALAAFTDSAESTEGK